VKASIYFRVKGEYGADVPPFHQLHHTQSMERWPYEQVWRQLKMMIVVMDDRKRPKTKEQEQNILTEQTLAVK
jgi:hypothetical protein